MDELEFRRRLFTDPNDKSPEVIEALRKNPARQNFVSELKQLEASLDDVLRVEVPESLADKILFQQTSEVFREKRNYKSHIAIAASIAFVLGIAVSTISNILPENMNAQTFVNNNTIKTIGELALLHSSSEENFVHNVHEKASLQQVNLKLGPLGKEIVSDLPGDITYVNYCNLDGIRALHVNLLDDKSKHIDIYFVSQTSSKITEIKSGNKQVVSVPYDDMSIILIAEKDMHIEDIAKHLMNNMSSLNQQI